MVEWILRGILRTRAFALIFLFTLCISSAWAQPRQRVGIIGGGGAGLTTAWLLENDADVTLFEKESKLGGHADTAYLELEGQRVPIEVGFEFFNAPLYPKFNRLLKVLNVGVNPYRLTYTFYRTDQQQDAFALPPFYIGGGINPDIMDLKYLVTMIQFKTFIDRGSEFLRRGPSTILLPEFVDSLAVAPWFKNEFLYPFLASMWGVSLADIRRFVAYPVVQWLVQNSGGGVQAPEFREVTGGLSYYIGVMALQCRKAHLRLNTAVTKIERRGRIYHVKTKQGHTYQFDHIVMATNAHQASQLLRGVHGAETVQGLLSKVEYFKTHIAIHGDWRVMPRNYSDWGVVNVRFDGSASAITAHKPWKHSRLRIYKSWVTKEVAEGKPLPQPLYALKEYWHPMLTRGYVDMQKGIAPLQGVNGLWITGMYTGGLDNHETAVTSAMRVARSLAPNSARLLQLTQ